MFDFDPRYEAPRPEPERAPQRAPGTSTRRRWRLGRPAVFALAALAQLTPLIAVLAAIGWAMIEASWT